MPALAFSLTKSRIQTLSQTKKEPALSSQSATSTAKADGNKKPLRAVPSAEPSNVQPKPKRSRFSATNLMRRDHGEQLVETLRAHQKQFPRFAPYLEQVISKVLNDSQRTRKGDQEMVLKCLREFHETGLLITDIVDDTGLSHWDVRQVLSELEKAGKVEFVPKPPPGIPAKNWRCRPRLWRLKKAKSQTQ